MTAAIDPGDDVLLRAAAGADLRRLDALRARVRAGEPAAYVAGFLEFGGRRFFSDRRAFITDTETLHLVDSVVAEGLRLQASRGRALDLLEFGVGAGTLAISVKLAQPAWRLSGVDIDPAALDLAAENTLLHGVKIDLIASDYLSGWPQDGTEPDIVFGDPPWGNASDLYDSHRDEHYYRQMPAASAFPPDGQRTAIHDELIRRIVARGWRSLLILNYGILPRELVARSAQPLAEWRLLHPQPQLSVLVGRGAL